MLPGLSLRQRLREHPWDYGPGIAAGAGSSGCSKKGKLLCSGLDTGGMGRVGAMYFEVPPLHVARTWCRRVLPWPALQLHMSVARGQKGAGGENRARNTALYACCLSCRGEQWVVSFVGLGTAGFSAWLCL